MHQHVQVGLAQEWSRHRMPIVHAIVARRKERTARSAFDLGEGPTKPTAAESYWLCKRKFNAQMISPYK
jgi:hypothetical protein